MTQNERRQFLIRKLLSEEPEYQGIEIPPHIEGQKRFLRSLMNVRRPRPIDAEILKIQDEYLKAEVEAKGIVDGSALPACPSNSGQYYPQRQRNTAPPGL